MTTGDLTRSIRGLGPLLPVFRCRGRIFDGRRRLEICSKYDVKIGIVDIKPVWELPITWALNPERIRSADFAPVPGSKVSAAVRASHDVWSDPGTVAAYWLGQAPKDGTKWNRLLASFRALLNAANEGGLELTPEKLLDAVRKNL